MKCQLLIGATLLVQHTCALVLHCVHSRRRTTFLVVFALCMLLAQITRACLGWTYLVEDGLGLTSVTGLLAIITTLSLSEQRSLSSLVLCSVSVCASLGGCVELLTGDLVLGVLLAILALAVGTAGLGNVDL
jgi:hypothetical protein